MKKHKIIAQLLVATIGIGITSCNASNNEEVKQKEANQEEVVSSNDNTVSDMSIEEIDQIRSEVESLQVEPVEIQTTDLREKIKQKWSKIHFYVDNDIVVKIKTYPYPEISKRTEEFYANNNGLVLVVIEDNGEGPKGKPKSELDKMYYFNNDKLIKESTKGDEQEFNIRNSDAEELYGEYSEYLGLYTKIKK